MAWIRTVPDDAAEGRLAGIYRRLRARAGRVANILRVQSLDPPALEAHLGLYKAVLFGPSPLSRCQRELIATYVSALNDCHY
ncbi:MAG: peroxidase [Planctomycetota bacterium]|nr:MAG: peroxidase [Planctomycetota bacterium]